MSEQTCYFFRIDYQFVRIDFDTIIYLEACKNYTRIVTAKKIYMALVSLRQLEAELPAGLFCRVHRSFIVYIDAVTGFNNISVTLGDTTLPLALSFRSGLVARLPVFFSNKGAKTNFMQFKAADLLPKGREKENIQN